MRATGRLVDLRAALAVAAAIPNKRNTIPILGNVRLRLNPPGEIEITATDLDCEYKARIPAEVSEGCSLTVPAQYLHDAAKSVAGDDFAIDLDMMSARFVAGASKFELPILPVTDFPDMATAGDWSSAKIAARDLARVLTHAQPFIFDPSQGSGRDYAIGGVFLHAGGSGLEAVATDRHRIAISSAPADITGKPSAVIPDKTVSHMLAALDGETGSVLIETTSSLVRLTVGDAVLTSSVLGGDFIQYERAIPKDFAHVATVSHADLKAAARRAGLANQGDRSPFLKVALSKGSLSISARSFQGFAEASDVIPADYDGPPLTLGIISRHMADALASVKSSRVAIHINEPRAPIRFEDVDEPARLLLTVPCGIGAAPVSEAA